MVCMYINWTASSTYNPAAVCYGYTNATTQQMDISKL
jgi:hypothetical protein